MFGLSFLFAGALWALPLAGAPVLLHLLYRRKNPVVMFSTLRFIKSSMKHNAARRRVQQWLLLACRALLLLLLILAAAQPAKLLASGWSSGSHRTMLAAIVVDTSYSMQLQEQQVTLLGRADSMVQDLLRDQLRDARIAIFKSHPAPADAPEQLRSASDLLSQWTPLKPEAADKPLSERIAAAVDMLSHQPADDKWLVVISDLQKREFPRQLAAFEDGRVVLLDLHPDDPGSAGITRVVIDPPQPTPGIGAEGVVDVAGQPGKPRPVATSIQSTDGKSLLQSPTQMATPDSAGHARLRFDLRLPAEHWMVLKAALQDEDNMEWDNARQMLVEVPPRQNVTLLDSQSFPSAQRFLRLALDPSEGHATSWPLIVKTGAQIAADANVVVDAVSEWPDTATAARYATFVRNGGTLIWFIRPGLESSWLKLPKDQRTALLELLPSEPLAAESISSAQSVGLGSATDPLLAGLTDKRFTPESIVVLRAVPFAYTDAKIASLLKIYPTAAGSSQSHGLLYRKTVGAGSVYTFATLPDQQFTNLPTHPLFLPLLVRMSLGTSARTAAENVELGQPLVLPVTKAGTSQPIRIAGPGGDVTAVAASDYHGAQAFVFAAAERPGIYTWQGANDNKPIALANVQLPAAESELHYVKPDDVIEPGESVVVARSTSDLKASLATRSAPEPHWTPFIAAVLLLMCMEAILGTLSTRFGAASWRSLIPGFSPGPTPS